MAVQIITHSALENFIIECFEAWRQLYPERWKAFREWAREAGKVQKSPDGIRVDPEGRETVWQFTMPAELLLFFKYASKKRGMPEFGEDPNDIRVMLRLFKDFDRTKNLGHQRIFTTGKDGGMSNETQRSDDNKGRDDTLAYVLGESS
jgi:hypothetical protein